MSDILVAGTTSYPSSIDTATPCIDGAVSGTDQSAVQVNGPAAAVLAVETELGTLPKGTAASVKARLAVALNDDGTIKSTVVVGPQVAYATGVFTISSSLAGQCHLARTNNTTLTLSRYNGSYLLINNVSQQIPAAGITLSNSGLSATTLYYIYAYMVSTTMTLEASTTGHVTDTTSGVEVKSGDATRTLIGMAYTNGSSAFIDTGSQRYVLNWYNRHPIASVNFFTTTVTTTSASYVEPSSTIRTEFLCWADDAVHAIYSGLTSVNTTAQRGQTSLAFDGTTAEDCMTGNQTGSSVDFVPTTVSISRTLTEGYHYATVLSKVAGGATYSHSVVSNAAGDRPTLIVRTQG